MDPLTALSLACNVIDLTGRAIKCAKIARDIYHSTTGLAAEYEQSSELIGELNTILGEVQNSHGELQRVEAGDTNIRAAARACQDISLDISALLDRCRINTSGSRRSAVSAAWRANRNQDDLQTLQANLEKRQQMLQLALTASIGTQIIKIVNALDKERVQNFNLKQQLRDIQQNLDRLGGVPGQLRQALDLCHEAQSARKLHNILRVLGNANNNMRSNPRYDDVLPAHEKTFEWIFREPEKLFKVNPELRMSFSDWLRDGGGIFHILGKPGSGKSTLMKFIWKHEHTKNALRQWAGQSRKLLYLKYFFWKPDPSQNELLGLKRSLLLSVLEQAPELLEVLLPRLNEHSRALISFIGDDEISQAFDVLMNDPRVLGQFKIFLLIDGLDEFDGKRRATDYGDLANIIQSWTSEPEGNIKACVSSREYAIFEPITRNQKFRLQKLTEKDMLTFIAGRLRAHPKFSELEESCVQGKYTLHQHPNLFHTCDPGCLSRHIVSRASGVFLWVRIMTTEIRSYLGHGLPVLWKRVDDKPEELTDFLIHMFDSIPYPYAREAYILLAVFHKIKTNFTFGVNGTTNPISIYGASFLWSEILRDAGSDSGPRISYDILTVEQVDSYFNGLLEVSNPMMINTFPPGSTPRSIFETLKRNINAELREQVSNFLDSLLEEVSDSVITDINFLGFTHRSIVETIEERIDARLREQGVTPIKLGIYTCQLIFGELISVLNKRKLDNHIVHHGPSLLLKVLENLDVPKEQTIQEKLCEIEDTCDMIEFQMPHPPDESWKRHVNESHYFPSVLTCAIRYGCNELWPWIWKRISNTPRRGFLATVVISNSTHPEYGDLTIAVALMERGFFGMDVLCRDTKADACESRCHTTSPWIQHVGEAILHTYKWESVSWRPCELWLKYGANPRIWISSHQHSVDLSVKVNGGWWVREEDFFSKRAFDRTPKDAPPLNQPDSTFREFVERSDAPNKERLLELIDRNTAWIDADDAAEALATLEELPSLDVLDVPEYVPPRRTARMIWRAYSLELRHMFSGINYEAKYTWLFPWLVRKDVKGLRNIQISILVFLVSALAFAIAWGVMLGSSRSRRGTMSFGGVEHDTL